MTDPATPVEGATLTSVTVNAASPDVVGTLMKQITAKVMEAIPAGSFERIAQEVLASGSIVTMVRDRWEGNKQERYVFSDAARQKFKELVDDEIKRQVQAYFNENDVQRMVANAVAEGVASSIAEVPGYAAQLAMKRMGDTMMGSWDASVQRTNLDDVRASLAKTQQALLERKIINYDEK